MIRSSSIMTAALAALIGFTAHAEAQEATDQMSFTARLAAENGPIDGTVDMTFKIYDDPAGTDGLVWEEDQNGVEVADGMVYEMLGVDEPLTPEVFDGGTMYLEVTVDNDVLSPRLALGTVPYATRAETANTFGDFTPDDVLPKGDTLECSQGDTVVGIDPDTGDVICEQVEPVLSCETASDDTEIDGNSNGSVSASCPSGTFVTGGGCSWSFSGDGSLNISRSAPAPGSNTSWGCAGNNDSIGSRTLTAIARCCTIE